MSGTKAAGPRHPGIYVYETRMGKRYAAVATVLGKQKWSRGHKTIALAEVAKEAMRAEMRGGALMTAPATLTLRQYLKDRWLPTLEGSITPATMRVYRQASERVAGIIGDERLIRLAPEHLELLKRRLRAAGLKQTTQAHLFATLSGALKRAVRWGLIARNPCDQVDPPKRGKYDAPHLETKDVIRLMKAADETPWGMLVYLAVMTGMRSAELFALRWQDVDMASGVLRVTKSKTAAGVRAVALGPDTLERLKLFRLEQMRRFEELKAPVPTVVFLDQDGLVLNQRRVWEPWDAIRKAAGLPAMHFHDLRHAQATLLARAGVHPSIAQGRLGHATSKMTLDVYTNTTAKDQEPAAAAVERLLSDLADA